MEIASATDKQAPKQNTARAQRVKIINLAFLRGAQPLR